MLSHLILHADHHPVPCDPAPISYRASGDWEDGEGDPCPACGRLYRTDEFWIACDACDTWYCGRCAKMTEKKAAQMKHWRCGQCAGPQ